MQSILTELLEIYNQCHIGFIISLTLLTRLRFCWWWMWSS